MASSNWDGEFDFQDVDQKKKPKKNQIKANKKQTQEDSFFDLQNDQHEIKLPLITSKAVNSNQEQKSKHKDSFQLEELTTKPIVNQKDKFKKNQITAEEYDVQELNSKRKNQQSSKQKNQKAQKTKIIQEPIKGEKQQENYANQFEADEDYEQDFEEVKQTPAKTQIKSSETKEKQLLNIPKPPQKLNQKSGSVAKVQNVRGRIESRTSVRSNEKSNISRNKSRQQEKRSSEQNVVSTKYEVLAQKTFPQVQRSVLEELSQDKLIKDNDRIRLMIKKFNDELNDLINKNILLMKAKKQDKLPTIQEIIMVLDEDKKNNEATFEITKKELQRLKGKEGELKGEEYQHNLEQKISESKVSINEMGKLITKLKFDIKNDGNKLSKQDKESTIPQEVNQIKNSLVNIKKDQEANEENLEKMEQKIQELNKKISEADVKMNQNIDQAKNKGISIQDNTQLHKKVDDSKKKYQIVKNHKAKSQALFKTKAQMLNHQIQQIRIIFKSLDSQIKITQYNCDQAQSDCRKIVEKAKKNTKITQQLLNNLQEIIVQIEGGNISHSSKQKDEPTTQPKNSKKYSSQKNVDKIHILMTNTEKQKYLDDGSINKPQLFKKKEQNEDKMGERVWKEEKEPEEKAVKQSTLQKIKESTSSEIKVSQKQQNKQEDKKKPFMIKKNRQSQSKHSDADNKADLQIKIQSNTQLKMESDKAEETTIAPRMMKFKKNKQSPNEQLKLENGDLKQTPKISEQLKMEDKSNKMNEKEQENPIIVPKRLTLKNRGQKRSEQLGYVASNIDSQVPKVEEYKPKLISNEEYKPKLISNEEYKPKLISNEESTPKIPIETKQDEVSEKPRFTLKLRDRQKNQNKIDLKLNEELVIKSPENVNLPKEEFPKQNTNPYVNQISVGNRKGKEGPIKKQKMDAPSQKQVLNIYEQAQDLTNVKEININNEVAKKVVTDEPDLKTMLGIEKKKAANYEELLEAEGKPNKQKKDAKKNNDYFADLEL